MKKNKNYLIFEMCNTYGYPARTFENARLADITIDFAFNTTGSGGKMGLTKIAAKKYNKHYVNVPITPDGFNPKDASDILNNEFKKYMHHKSLSINFAGHELGKMNISQKVIDQLVEKTLDNVLLNLSKYNVYIEFIRSGGQTGFDEAGIKAGMVFDIPTFILAPKNWLYRPYGKDVVGDEKGFKDRFLNLTI